MQREFSAGGVVLHRISDAWWIAAIEPQRESTEAGVNTGAPLLASSARSGKETASLAGTGKDSAAPRRRKTPAKPIFALPKGLVDPGEQPADTALREVREETGITASLITKLTDIKYVYVRSWGDRQRVFKIVSFYLLRYHSGNIDDISPEMRIEVRRALWLPLHEAVSKLAYSGERQVVRKAQQYLEQHAEG
jgi:8-oxo-dGTP pyrophosphatase MutT (NUDIX family)